MSFQRQFPLGEGVRQNLWVVLSLTGVPQEVKKGHYDGHNRAIHKGWTMDIPWTLLDGDMELKASSDNWSSAYLVLILCLWVKDDLGEVLHGQEGGWGICGQDPCLSGAATCPPFLWHLAFCSGSSPRNLLMFNAWTRSSPPW